MKLIDDAFCYGDAEHEFCLREGYCFLDPFLTEDGLQWCRQNLDGMIARLHPGRMPEEIYSAHQSLESSPFVAV